MCNMRYSRRCAASTEQVMNALMDANNNKQSRFTYCLGALNVVGPEQSNAKHASSLTTPILLMLVSDIYLVMRFVFSCTGSSGLSPAMYLVAGMTCSYCTLPAESWLR